MAKPEKGDNPAFRFERYPDGFTKVPDPDAPKVPAETATKLETAPPPLDDQALNKLRKQYRDEKGLDEIGNFSDGRARVRKGKQWWHIKADGTDLSSARYDEVYSFSGGRAWVRKGKQWWFIKADGTDLSSARYDEASSFSNGRAWVRKGKQWWFIKEDGTDLSSARYDEVYSFSGGRARVKKDGQEWFIDTNGNKIADT